MSACSQNYVTPTMIKKGHVTIGDRIRLEEDVAVNAQVPPETAVSAVAASEEVSAPAENLAEPSVSEESVPAAASAPENISMNNMSSGSSAMGNTQSWPQGTANMPGTTQAAPFTPAPAPFPSPGPGPVPAPGSASTSRSPQTGSGRRESFPTSPWGQENVTRAAELSTVPLIFENMTEYANMLSGTTGNTPVFTVPSHPLAPPEYDQTLDYDSIQYMNGFLRTQIGRHVMVQQLIGSGNTNDRYGFLVGVGNNYLLLQEMSNGNIMVIDFYTVKYVYIYYSQPVYPSFQLPQSQDRMMI